MGWNVLSPGDVLEELSPQEAATLRGIQGAVDLLPKFTSRAVEECRGAIAGGNYPLGSEGTIPDGLASDVIAIARWRWLLALPQVAKLQTKEREAAFKDAQAKLAKVTQHEYAPESPEAGTNPKTGNWNSENKVIGRTHPVPRPSAQAQSSTGAAAYANPEGPAES